MKIINLLVLAFILTGCETIGICDYALPQEEWLKVDTPPKNLTDKYNNKSHWFTNEEGDFFACPKLKKKGVCTNVYEIYRKLPDGSFDRQFIACMT